MVSLIYLFTVYDSGISITNDAKVSQNLAYTTAIQPKTIITNTSTMQTDRPPAAFTNQITELREKIHLLSTSNLIIAANIQKSMSTEALDTIVNKPIETDMDVKFRYKFTDPDAEPVRRSWPRKDRKSLDLESLPLQNTTIGSAETLSEPDAIPPPLPISRPPTIISSLRKSEIIINDELLKTEVAKKSEKSVQFQRTPTPPAPELEFKPIKASRSTENLSAILLKPIPRYPPSLSKSTQDLRVKDPEFRQLRAYEISKSSDDLIFPDIDGLRKSQRLNKRWRMRSHESITSVDDEELYANLPISSFTKQPSESVTIIKKPLPLPRQNSFTTESLTDLRETLTDLQPSVKSKSSIDLRPRIDSTDDRRGSKTIVYVFDKVADEFVLQSSDPDTSYEDLTEKTEVPVASTAHQRNSQIVKIAVAPPITPTRVHPIELTGPTKAPTAKSKFSFFGIGKKTPQRDPNASAGFYGSKGSLVEEKIVDNEFGENPLFRIKSMEDLEDANGTQKSIGSASLSTFKTSSFSREAIVASARKSSSSSSSVFYVPNPSDADGHSASGSKFSVVFVERSTCVPAFCLFWSTGCERSMPLGNHICHSSYSLRCYFSSLVFPVRS